MPQLPRWSLLAIAGACLIAAARCCPWRAGMVVGHSMEPTLSHGSVFLYEPADRSSPRLQAGDIVLLRLEGKVAIKRIYAAGGDRFWAWREVQDGAVWCTPIRATQRGLFARLAAQLRARFGSKVEVARIVVPSDHLFIVGDGAQSHDSRQLGTVPRSCVLGRVLGWPGQRFAQMPAWIERSFPTRQELASAGRSAPPDWDARRHQAALRNKAWRARSRRAVRAA